MLVDILGEYCIS